MEEKKEGEKERGGSTKLKEENVILAAKRKEKQKASVKNEKNPSDKSAN